MGVTLADVTRAADQIIAEGERPTLDSVRRILGAGSPGTVNTLLKQYFQALPGRLNLPAPIATAAAELYAQVQATTLKELASERAAQEKDLVDERARVAQDRRDVEAERSAVQQRAADLNGELEKLREQLKNTSAKLAATEKEVTAQATRATTAEAQFRAVDEERERFTQKHAGDLARLREQAEGNERHLQARIEEQKTQIQRFVQDRERETDTVAKHAAVLEASVSEGSKQLASLRAELATAQRDLAKRQEAVTSAETALARAQEQTAKDQAAKQAELERARGEIELLGDHAEQHKRERDEAIRESGKLEGRLAALQGQLAEAKAEITRLQKTKALEASGN